MTYNEETVEKVIELRDTIIRLVTELAGLIGEGYLKRPEGDEYEALDWKSKDGKPASPDDAWAWTFARERDGTVAPVKQKLAEHLKAHGKLVSARYTYSMTPDGRFFHRRKVATDQK